MTNVVALLTGKPQHREPRAIDRQWSMESDTEDGLERMRPSANKDGG
jgi:hypothetical protein